MLNKQKHLDCKGGHLASAAAGASPDSVGDGGAGVHSIRVEHCAAIIIAASRYSPDSPVSITPRRG